MLCLSLKPDEAIQLGPDITVTVGRLARGHVHLSIEAPRSVRIDRLAQGVPKREAPPTADAPVDDRPYSDLAALEAIDREGHIRHAPGTVNEKLDALRRFTACAWVETESGRQYLTFTGVKERNRLACAPLILQVA